MSKFRLLFVFLLLFVSIVLLAPGGVGAQVAYEPVPDWPELYDPFTLLDYHLEMSSGDWNTIVGDLTYDIEVPAKFWAEDEAPILVSVRRKSAELLGSDKISLKVDINEYEDGGACAGTNAYPGVPCVSKWHGVKKLSLENGDDNNVVTEGLAWYMHSEAAKAMNYQSGMASWVTVTVNGDNKGVYINVEQPDKQYLKNRGMWDGDDTWLYKYSDVDSPEIKEYPEDLSPVEYDSPLYDEFCFSPFRARRACSTPGNFKDLLNAKINMEGLLTFGAVAAFQGSPDDLYPKDKNFYFVDYTTPEEGLREYLEWDLDSAFSANKVDGSIYDQSRKSDVYEKALIESSNAPFRAEYDAIMWRLLDEKDGPLREAALHDAFTAIELEIGAAVAADPNNQIGDSVSGQFDSLRQFITARTANVIGQLPPPPPDPDPPVAAFTYSDNYLAVDFTDASSGTIDSWSWDFGDGNSSSTASPSHTYAAAGTYTVSLTVTNAVGSSTANQTITVTEPPLPDPPLAAFTSSVNYLMVDFTDASTGTIDSWSWDFGDTTGSTAASPSHNYASAGTYTVSLTVTNAAGSSTTSQTITVTEPPLPDPPLAAFTYTVGGLTVDFTDASTGTIDSWSWDFGDTTGSTATSPSHTYAAAGTYTVSLTVANASGSSTASQVITIAAPATMHLGSLTGVANPGFKGKWTATATITVHDGSHVGVSGVVVSGTWSGDYIAGASCTTNSSGQCSLITGMLNKNKKSVTFAVDDLSGALAYAPADNDVGATVTISK